MIDVIHKPSGMTRKVNQTQASRLMEYSKKHNRGWEYVENKTTKKKEPKPKKNEDTNSESGSSDS